MAPKMKYGSRVQVMNGTAAMTTGKLKKGDLMKNKWGDIVSRKKHALGLKSFTPARKALFAANRATPFKPKRR